MFKKVQLRFIAFTMAICLAILSAFYGIAYIIFRFAYTESIHETLNDNFTAYTEGSNYFKPNVAVIILTDKNMPNNFNVVAGGNEFEYGDIEAVCLDARPYTEKSTGTIGDIYYLVGANDVKTGEIIIVAARMTAKLNSMRVNLLRTLWVFVFILVASSLITVLASYYVILPIKESFYKQQRFISDASHELRTPLTIVSASADVLKSQVKDNEYLNNIKTQTARMEYLVSDLLALAKNSERVSMKKESFSVTEEVNMATLPYESIFFEKGKTLITEVDENVTYTGYRENFKTVLNILLDNASKHSAQKATVWVTLKKEGGHIRLTVKNTGSEVKDENSDKVFERFYRADGSRSRSSGGSGLGLAIAKTVCDANKWKISAKSIYQESMTITVII